MHNLFSMLHSCCILFQVAFLYMHFAMMTSQSFHSREWAGWNANLCVLINRNDLAHEIPLRNREKKIFNFSVFKPLNAQPRQNITDSSFSRKIRSSCPNEIKIKTVTCKTFLIYRGIVEFCKYIFSILRDLVHRIVLRNRNKKNRFFSAEQAFLRVLSAVFPCSSMILLEVLCD